MVAEIKIATEQAARALAMIPPKPIRAVAVKLRGPRPEQMFPLEKGDFKEF